ncbi:4-amino-4-deoxy-L-arabinose transferase [Anaerolinea thermolimosa]|mgnify:CR=1 FL=1|uniref:protein O-mannosyl-transferase family n=1 Tax=Anaerolinea thermolimosa TaxID=229919 RepID=UPI00078461A7|nr:DUF2723 domain-containing protein [Anaerolinea thermolimosa]GAP05901.1 4-amino-4-deoxy-L-arabinose transferase [Anaerolinea thermolimosa]
MAEGKDDTTIKATRLDVFVGALLFLLASILYLRTLAPSLLLGDSAEFQALSYTPGLAHATSYPIYLLLGRLFVLLPFESVAYRVNLLSAIMASLTLVFMFAIGRNLGAGRLASLAGPVALGISFIFWWHAVIAEVYTAGAAFLSAVLWLVLLWKNTGKVRFLFLAGLLGGLSLGVHNTVVLVAPGIFLFLLLTRCDRRGWVGAIAGAVAGVLLFLAAFFILDSYQTPATFTEVVRPMNDLWGYRWEDFNSPLRRFEYLFLAAQWRRQMFSMSPPEVEAHVQGYFSRLTEWFPWPVVILAVAGWAALFIRSLWGKKGGWPEGLLLGVGWLGIIVYIVNYNIGDIETFYISSYVLLFSLTGVGISWPGAWLGKALKKPQLGMLITGFMGVFALTFALLPSIHRITTAWEEKRISFLLGSGQEWYPYPIQYPQSPLWTAENIVNHLEPNAILFTSWDKLYGVWYAASVNHNRSDLRIHEMYPFGSDGRLSPQTLEYLRKNLGKHPIYFTQNDPVLESLGHLQMVDGDIPLFLLKP